MRPSVLHRVLAVLAALTFIFAGSMPVSAAPAAKARVDLFVRSYTLAPGTGAFLYTQLFADRRVSLPRGAIKIKYRFINQGPGFHFTEPGTPNNCSYVQPDNNLELDCAADAPVLTPAGVDSGVYGWISAGRDAVPGSTGTITATMTIKGYAPVTRTAKLRIGEAVALSVDAVDREVTSSPGRNLDLPVTITNSGSVAARGLVALGNSQYAFESRTQYRNCTYVDGVMRSCTFDQTIAPGASYRLALPLRVRANTYAPSVQYGSTSWMTDEEFADLKQYAAKGGVGYLPLGTPGRGGVLRLTEVAAARAKADLPQALNPESPGQHVKLTVTGKQIADLAGVGDRASGRKGAVVTVSVGLHNNGPAAIEHATSELKWPTTRVYIPKGTTAVRVPTSCSPMTERAGIDENRRGAPGERRYSCELNGLLKPGGTTTVDFGLRIDQVITGARGAAVSFSPDDLTKTNDSAPIVINPAVASGGQGGGGGGLPITGPAVLSIGAIGLVLVIGGATAFLMTRRRRTFRS
ncbi:hypothetical protein KOI35_44190 [Actinoplanes bogorensis]|uniref:DUF11 domain-containing protein n=1 Tax=Paractinoplanes bogorensis TaxID=1610840 RepID=A0ABS5Z4B4_9ACTN|nr:hypothetical protein [Actinoplanes bogorensis]MBU2670524.1 hypothetical protein [Actinoplanes bogorensis]